MRPFRKVIPREPVDRRSRKRLIPPMGILRSPHEATCPSIASRFLIRGRSHVILYDHISRQAFPTDRHGAHACPDRRSYRRGFRRRSAADSRRRQTQPCRSLRLGRGIFRPLGHRRLPARPEAQRRAPPPGCGISDVSAEALEGGFEGWKEAKLPLVPAAKLPAARRAGPHRLGHARAAEDRPHRLPVADPPLRRSERGVPVRRAVRKCWRSASGSMLRPSTSRTCSGATAANSAPST